MAQETPTDLPEGARVWCLKVNGESYTYGDMHEIMHRDIAIGNDFRKERIKLLITLATGVFALMVTFHKDLFGGHETSIALNALLIGFFLLLVSVVAGIWHFKGWENFYLAHRGLSNAVWSYHVANGDTAKQHAAANAFATASKEVKAAQDSYHCNDFVQTFSLILGLVFILIYVGIESQQLLLTDTKCATQSEIARPASPHPATAQ